MNSLFDQLMAEAAARAQRRKCFISHYSADKIEVDKFIEDFSDIFIPKAIGVTNGDDFIDSDDPDYVMSRIREKYLGDSTVTICLVGQCTHSRRYIDWEIKTTLRRGNYMPNGLLAILLPSMGKSGHLPPRIHENWDSKDDTKAYALYRVYPSTGDTLKKWIDEAYNRRTTHADLIINSQDMMKYNHKCRVHGVTH